MTLYKKFSLKERRIQNFLWKGFVYKIILKRALYTKFSFKGHCMKKILKRAVYTKFSLIGHCIRKYCIRKFLSKGIVSKIFFQSYIYKILVQYKIFFKGRCIQKEIFDRVLHGKFSLTGLFIRHFLWKGDVYKIVFEWFVVYNIFFEMALYTTFSLKGRCIQNCKCLCIEENLHLSIFTLFVAIFYMSKITLFPRNISRLS